MRDLIEQRIREYLADTDPRFDWLRAKVREEHFLPLYIGWIEVIAIRPDQTLMCWNHEDTGEVTVLDDALWARTALCEGAKKYPELDALIPARPAGAVLCGTCGGSGGFPGPRNDIICACGGVGWVIPGERQRQTRRFGGHTTATVP